MGQRAARAARTMRGFAGMGVVLAMLGACVSDGVKGPHFPFSASWQRGKGAAPVLLTDEAWWQRLNDPVLNSLVTRALSGSLTIAAAKARIAAADGALRAVPGAFDYSAALSGSMSDSKSRGTPTISSGSLGLSWLLDPWGGRRAEARSAAARLAAARAERDAAQLLVLSNLGNAYLELRFRQALYQQGLRELDSRKQMLALTQSLQDASSATRVDLTRSEARVAEIEAGLPAQRAQMTAKQNEIAVLAGVVPGQLGIDLGPAAQPRPRMAANMGIPADLLRNRPDIGVAEQRYYEALALVDVTQAAQYPNLSLTGSIDLSHARGGGGAAQYLLSPRLAFPRASQAAVEARGAEARAAYLVWTGTVTAAIGEVETALSDYAALSSAQGAAEKSVHLYKETRDLTNEVFRAGNATLSDVIDADTDVARAESALAEARFRQAQAFVALNVALGAGSSFGAQPVPAN